VRLVPRGQTQGRVVVADGTNTRGWMLIILHGIIQQSGNLSELGALDSKRKEWFVSDKVGVFIDAMVSAETWRLDPGKAVQSQLLEEGLVMRHGRHVLGDDDFDKSLGVIDLDGFPVGHPRKDVSIAIAFNGVE
jgi:hypothetical protein